MRTGCWRLRIKDDCRMKVPSSWLELPDLKMVEQASGRDSCPSPRLVFQEQGLFHYLCCPLEEEEGHTGWSH